MLAMDVLASTGSILEVVVTLEASTTTELTWTSTILDTSERCAEQYRQSSSAVRSHVTYDANRTLQQPCLAPAFDPGLPLQVGMRHFNIRKNKYHCPIVNLDKLWSLVGHEVCRNGHKTSCMCASLVGDLPAFAAATCAQGYCPLAAMHRDAAC